MRKTKNVANAAYLYITGKGTQVVCALLFTIFVASFASISIYARVAHAATNSTINFQARVLQANGAVVPDGNVSVEFKIYNVASGGVSEWNDTFSLPAKNGYITTSLGSGAPFSASIDWSQEHWLTMNINGDGEMGPTRMKMTAVPYSFRSGQADTLTNGASTISASQLAQLAPGSVQGVNSANTALRINQTGAGNLLQLQGGGLDKFTVANTGDTSIGGSLTVTDGITVGNSASTTAGTIRWTGAVFEGYNGSAWTSLGGSALGNPIINKVKLVDEIQNSAVNATATLQDDDELFFAIGANETWTFRFMVQGNANATPDFKFAVAAPGGAVCKFSTADHEAAVSVANLGCGVSTGLVTGNTTNDLYEFVGTVTNGATAGDVTLRWAQNTANVANSTIYAGSSVLATRAVGANGTAQAFIQNGNSFGAAAFLGTNDGNDLNFITDSTTRLTVLANGNVGVGDTSPMALFTVGSGDALRVNSAGDLATSGTLTVDGQTRLNSNLVAGAVATATTTVAEPTPRINVTALTLVSGVFANNDIVFIDNGVQDYYTRIVSGGGTTNVTVSPAVSYDASSTITKYNVQNIGATDSDHTSQSNRFFQGYFLGGVVVGAGSTTLSDGNLLSTTDLNIQKNGGLVNIGGDISITGTITGDGSGLTDIDGSQIVGGSIGDTSLSSNVTLLGNTFNGASKLVQLDAAGALPALSGVALTTLNATNISSGTLDDLRLSSSVTLLGNTFNSASELVRLDTGGLLPILNGSALTSLNASNISSGTLDDLRLSSNVTLKGNTFNGVNGLVQLDGSGLLPILNGSALTNINASNISSGTLDDSRLSSNVTLLGNTFNGASELVQLDATGALPALNGVALTTLNATNISSGTLDDSRLSSNVTLLGNTFNGSNQLLKLDGSGALPALNAAALTNLSAGNVASGTLGDGYLSSNITRLDTSQAFIAQQTFAANLILGTDAASPTAGLVNFHDATGSNGFTAVLGTSSLTASRAINLPDESGTLCIRNSTACGFIMLASGTAQTDTTTNASLFINKTGASGDIMTLQKNGTTVYSVLNSGALQLVLTDASAFTVRGGGGTTQYFNVDTSSGLVQIGDATADANATLLVLDAKDTTGDPAGVNGGSYYNSADGKNRCYEGGVWADCSTMRLVGETTLGAANGTIDVTLNGNYEYLECRVDTKGRSAASMPYVRFNNNTGAAAYGWNAYGIIAAAGTDWQDASDSEIQLSGTQTGTNPFSANLKITNFTDTNKVVDWTAAGLEPVGTNSNRYSGVGGFYNTTSQITSVQFVLSAGTFNTGSHAWCQGKNIR